MTLIKSFEQFYTLPLRTAMPIVTDKKTSICDSIIARLLFVVQLVVAVVALPFAFILGAFVVLLSSERGKAFSEWCLSLRDLMVVVIPGSLFGIFLPLASTSKCIEAFSSCKCCCDNEGRRNDMGVKVNIN
jgi:uncharacterized membrane protein YraQ (UPF0718 family)